MRTSEFQNENVGLQKVAIPTDFHNMEISRKVKQDLLLQLLMKAFVCNQVHSRQRDYFDMYISFNNNVNFFTLRTFDSWSFYSAKFKLDYIGPEKSNTYSINGYSKVKMQGQIAVKC